MSRGRIRSIKPEFAYDGNMKRLSDSCALFFILFWTQCDDEGKHKNDPLEIATKLGRWHQGKVRQFIKSLTTTGQLRVNSGSTWLQVVHWSHQRIDKPKQPKVKAQELQWVGETNSTNDLGPFQDESKQGSDRIGSDQIEDPAGVLGFPDEPAENTEKPIDLVAKVIALWNEMMPDKQAVIPYSHTAMHANILARDEELQKYEKAWEVLFRKVQNSDFLMGRVEGKPWRADLRWLVEKTFFDKVWSGQYGDRQVAQDREYWQTQAKTLVKALNEHSQHDSEAIARLQRDHGPLLKLACKIPGGTLTIRQQAKDHPAYFNNLAGQLKEAAAKLQEGECER